MEIITDEELAAYLQQTLNAEAADLIIELANDLVSEVVGDEVDPASARLRAITLEVAARAYRNPRGTSSLTRSFDDSSRTERWEGAAGAQGGVYLTDEETAELLGIAGKKTYGTVRLGVPMVTGHGSDCY